MSKANPHGLPPTAHLPLQIALTSRMPPIGYTFILAGFLKIMTMGALVSSAPQDAVRTALGEPRAANGRPGCHPRLSPSSS